VARFRDGAAAVAAADAAAAAVLVATVVVSAVAVVAAAVAAVAVAAVVAVVAVAATVRRSVSALARSRTRGRKIDAHETERWRKACEEQLSCYY
jgi:hypothetical protein